MRFADPWAIVPPPLVQRILTLCYTINIVSLMKLLIGLCTVLYPSDRGALSSWQLIASPDRMRPLSVSDQLPTNRMVCDMDGVLRIDHIQDHNQRNAVPGRQTNAAGDSI